MSWPASAYPIVFEMLFFKETDKKQPLKYDRRGKGGQKSSHLDDVSINNFLLFAFLIREKNKKNKENKKTFVIFNLAQKSLGRHAQLV